ncbi:MAG: efflux RND transporter permease subunit, partial [Pseudomonadota bacterium]
MGEVDLDALETAYEEGLAAEKAGDAEGAAWHFRHCLALDPDDRGGAAVRLAALGLGPVPERAPPAYVATLFDQHAESFEMTLVHSLGYAIPEAIAEALAVAGLGPFARGVDLGCGTGLVGEALEGRATAVVEMREGTNLDRFASDVKTEIDGIDDFPDLVEEPIVKQLGRTDFVASVAVSGAMSRPDLKTYAEQVKRRMQAFGGIPKIEISGFAERQFRVEILDATLRQFGLSLQDVATTIQRQNIDLPVGTIQGRDGEILLRFADERRSVEALRDLIIISSEDGGQIRLGDIARIDDRFESDEVKILFDGEPAALLEVTKSAGDDLLSVIGRIEAFLAEERQRAPPGVQFTIVRSPAEVVQDRLSLLVDNGAVGLALVAVTMWLFFGIRYAFWISAGLPVAFVGGIAAMVLLGYSLNMLTMVGLLIVVGLLMDDAIVISESIATKREAGAAPMEAAVAGVQEVAPGVLSSFLTTLCIFGSLAILEGDIGQVLRVVPVVMLAGLDPALHGAAPATPGRQRMAKMVGQDQERISAHRHRACAFGTKTARDAGLRDSRGLRQRAIGLHGKGRDIAA